MVKSCGAPPVVFSAASRRRHLVTAGLVGEEEGGARGELLCLAENPVGRETGSALYAVVPYDVSAYRSLSLGTELGTGGIFLLVQE